MNGETTHVAGDLLRNWVEALVSELAAARPAVGLQRKYHNLKEYLHDTCINLRHSSGEVHVILEVC